MVVKGTFIILQARMNSERLPGKIMKPIMGKPMIGHLIERLKKASLPIILATSKNKENNVLCDYVKIFNINIFRGSEDNVLERFYFAAKEYKAKYIVRVTGDNPLIDGKFIYNSLISIGKEIEERIYFSTGKGSGLPIGLSFEFFSFKLLEEAYKFANDKAFKEHVTPYMHQNIPGDIKLLTRKYIENKSMYRLTVDTIEDFELIKSLIEIYNCHVCSIDKIIEIIDKNKELVKINKDVIQKSWEV